MRSLIPTFKSFASVFFQRKQAFYSQQALALADCYPPRSSLKNIKSTKDSPKLHVDGYLQDALRTVHHTLQQGLPVSADVFYDIIVVCIQREDLEAGREAFCLIVLGGLDSDTFLGSHLIRMFASFGSLSEANRVFRRLHKLSVFTWSAIIAAHVDHAQGNHAVQIYQHMLRTCSMPDSHLFVAVLRACASMACLITGNLVHTHILVSGYEQVVHMGSALVDMYAKCGSLENAFAVFESLSKKDVVSWNSIITGCAQYLLAQEALHLFQRMLAGHLEPDRVTLASVLKACSSIKSLGYGMLIHVLTVDTDHERDLLVGNAIVDIYAKCGSFDAALNVFRRMPKRDVVTWSAISSECSQDEGGHMNLELFPRMEQDGIVPDHAMFLCILRACSCAVAFHQGKQIHAQYIESGLDLSADASIANTLIDMYSKCGSLADAYHVLSRLPKRDLVTWNVIIAGCAHQRNCMDIFKYYRMLQQEGHEPDGVTFMALLYACNHLGLVQLACHYFTSMQVVYNISPTIEHYNCMVDLLSHWGHLQEAEDFLLLSSVVSDDVGRASLLNQSKVYGQVDLAQQCLGCMAPIKGRNATSYLSMSQACSDGHHVDRAGAECL